MRRNYNIKSEFAGLVLTVTAICICIILLNRRKSSDHPDGISMGTKDFVTDEDFEKLLEGVLRTGHTVEGLRDLHNATLNVDAMYNNTDIVREKFRAIRHQTQVVPNIVHYIWFGNTRHFSFLYYLSILSAHKIQHADAILFHHDNVPSGPWWELLNKQVSLTMVRRIPASDIFNQTLDKVFHQGDLAKLQVLIEYGGIYVDLDVLILKSMEPLLHYDVTVGKEIPPKFIAGVIIGRKNAKFLLLWYESYRSNYFNDYWDYNCAQVPYLIHIYYPSLLHVEPYRLTTPDWTERHLLTEATINWGSKGLYILHAMSHLSDIEVKPEVIQSTNTTIANAARFIYSL